MIYSFGENFAYTNRGRNEAKKKQCSCLMIELDSVDEGAVNVLYPTREYIRHHKAADDDDDPVMSIGKTKPTNAELKPIQGLCISTNKR